MSMIMQREILLGDNTVSFQNLGSYWDDVGKISLQIKPVFK